MKRAITVLIVAGVAVLFLALAIAASAEPGDRHSAEKPDKPAADKPAADKPAADKSGVDRGVWSPERFSLSGESKGGVWSPERYSLSGESKGGVWSPERYSLSGESKGGRETTSNPGRNPVGPVLQSGGRGWGELFSQGSAAIRSRTQSYGSGTYGFRLGPTRGPGLDVLGGAPPGGTFGPSGVDGGKFFGFGISAPLGPKPASKTVINDGKKEVQNCVASEDAPPMDDLPPGSGR